MEWYKEERGVDFSKRKMGQFEKFKLMYVCMI